MADGAKKEIRIQFVVDQVSAQQAQRIIRSLIGDAERLAKTLGGVGFGGGGGGGGGGFGVAGISGSVGGASTVGQMRQSMAQARGPQPGGQKALAQVFVDNANTLKNLANVSRDSMRVMSDGIKRAVDEQKRSLEGLDKIIDRVTKQYDKLREAGKLDSPEGQKAQGYHMKLLKMRQGGQGNLEELERQASKLDEAQSGGPQAPGMGQRMMNALLGRGKPPNLPGGLGNIPGIKGMMAGSLIAYGVKAIGGAVGDVVTKDPFVYQEARARQAQMWAPEVLGMRQGNLAMMNALQQLNDPSKRKDFENISGSAFRRSMRWQQFSFSNLLKGNFYDEIAKQSDANINTAVQGEQRRYLDTVNQADPYTRHYQDRMTAEFRGRLGGMTRIGIGNYTDPKTKQYRTAYDDFVLASKGRFDPSEVLATHVGIEGAGGSRALAHKMTYAALYSGMPGAETMIGQAGETGAKAARDFMDQLMTSSGDFAALSRVGLAATAMQQQAGTGQGARGLLSALTQGLTGGEGDALIARQNAQGLHAYEQLITKGGDGFQQGVNTIIAAKYFGKYGAQAVQFAATGMSQAEVEEAGRGHFSETMKALGLDQIGATSFRRFQGEKEMTELLQRTVGGEKLPGGGYMDTVNKIRDAFEAGSTPEEWFKKLNVRERQKALRDIAAAERVTHEGMDEATAFGEARRVLMGYTGGTSQGRRGAAGGEIEGKAAAAQNAEDQEFAKQMRDKAQEWKSQLDALAVGTSLLSNLSQDIFKNGEMVAGALGALAETVNAVATGKTTGKDALNFFKGQVNKNQLGTVKKSTDSSDAGTNAAGVSGGVSSSGDAGVSGGYSGGYGY